MAATDVERLRRALSGVDFPADKSDLVRSVDQAGGGCCIARSQSSREPQIEVGQIAMTSSSKAAGTRRFTTCSIPSS
jgi:hypothetical protein